ncbi:hypothetical protein AB0N31_05015 [Streptomyces sp. NPDC051051]|uniref:hypothetical protein n=1 Tax=Streptomyces sp. NPDC051051 TaxID=3155666 RepID=UPI00341713D9
MVPVAQLYVRDIPLLLPPGQADLLQALWCPFEQPQPLRRSAALFNRRRITVCTRAEVHRSSAKPCAAGYRGALGRLRAGQTTVPLPGQLPHTTGPALAPPAPP